MIGKKFCPNCGSEDVELVAGGMTGSYMCADCGYAASIFPEKPMNLKGGESEENEEDIDHHALLGIEEEIDEIEKPRKINNKGKLKVVKKIAKSAKKRGKK